MSETLQTVVARSDRYRGGCWAENFALLVSTEGTGREASQVVIERQK